MRRRHARTIRITVDDKSILEIAIVPLLAEKWIVKLMRVNFIVAILPTKVFRSRISSIKWTDEGAEEKETMHVAWRLSLFSWLRLTLSSSLIKILRYFSMCALLRTTKFGQTDSPWHCRGNLLGSPSFVATIFLSVCIKSEQRHELVQYFNNYPFWAADADADYMWIQADARLYHIHDTCETVNSNH